MSREFTFQTKWAKEQRRDELFAGLIVSSLKAHQIPKVMVVSRGFLRLQKIQVQLKCSKTPSLGMGKGSWWSGSLKIKGVSYYFHNCSGGRKLFAACSVQPWDEWEAWRSLVNKQEAFVLCKWRNAAYKAEFYTELVIFISYKCGMNSETNKNGKSTQVLFFTLHYEFNFLKDKHPKNSPGKVFYQREECRTRKGEGLC